VPGCRNRAVSTSQRSHCLHYIKRRCRPPHISSVTSDHDVSHGEAGRLVIGAAIRSGPCDRSGIPAYGLHDRVVANESSTAEFGVIDLIAQQNPETDAEFAPHGDAPLSDALLLQFAAIESAKPRLVTRRLQAGLAPQESYESIALLRELP
jgi:hypothetical protein